MATVSIEKGKVYFSLHDAIEEMTDQEKRELADSVAVHDAVIDLVAQQIITGWTEFDSHGGTGHATSEPYRGLCKAWRDVAKASSEVAKKEIERLEESLKRLEVELQAMRDKEAQRIRSRDYYFSD